MSFLVSNATPSRVGGTSPQIGGGDFYGTAFKQGVYDQFFTSLYRMSEYQQSLDVDDELNPLIPQEQANHNMQQQGIDLKFDRDVSMDEMNLLARRKVEEQDRLNLLASGDADSGWGSGRSWGRFGTQFLGNVLSPIDLPLMFIPIVGTSAKVAGAGRLGSIARRGLVTEEALAAKGLAFKGYTAAIIEGSVGAAITEIPLFISNSQEQRDYTLNDHLLGVSFGAGFGALVNTGRLMYRGMKSARSVHRNLSDETKQTMSNTAMSDFLDGQPINPGRYLELDDSISINKTLSDEIKRVEQNDALFRERYNQLAPRDKEIIDFNRGNKLVDDNGLPIIVYHGRTWEGTQFDESLLGKNTGAASAKQGFFFAGNVKTSQYYILRAQHQNDPKVAALFDEMDDLQTRIRKNPERANEILKERFSELHNEVNEKLGIQNVFKDGGNVGAFMISLKNPQIIDFEGAFHRPEAYAAILKKAKAAGHDGVVIKNTFDGGPLDDVYVTFDKKSIRSAYDYRIARGAQQKMAASKAAIEEFKAKEAERAKNKAAKLQEEIEMGNTLPPEQIRSFKDVPTEEDIAKLDEEIEFLQQQFREELDDELAGNVKAVTREQPSAPNPLYHYAKNDFRDHQGPMWFTTTDKKDFAEYFDTDTLDFRPKQQLIKTDLTHLKDYFYDPYDSIRLNADIKYADTQFLREVRLLIEKETGLKLGVINKKNQINNSDRADKFAEGATSEFQQKLIQDKSLRKEFNKIFEDFQKRDPVNFQKVYEGSTIGIPDRSSLVDSQLDIGQPSIPKTARQKLSAFTKEYTSGQWSSQLPESMKFGADGLSQGYKAEDVAMAVMNMDSRSAKVLDELFKLDPTLSTIKVRFDKNLVTSQGAAGMYYGGGDAIALNHNVSPSTFVHELVHATAVRRFRQDLFDNGHLNVTTSRGMMYRDGLESYANKTDNESLKGLVNSYIKAVDYHNKVYGDSGEFIWEHVNPRNYDDYADNVVHPYYGLSNFDEFITEALTDRQFQLFLNSIPGTRPNKTLLQEFIDMFREFFGVRTESGSLLDEIYADYRMLSETSIRNPDGFLKNMRAASSADINQPMLVKSRSCILNAQA